MIREYALLKSKHETRLLLCYGHHAEAIAFANEGHAGQLLMSFQLAEAYRAPQCELISHINHVPTRIFGIAFGVVVSVHRVESRVVRITFPCDGR